MNTLLDTLEMAHFEGGYIIISMKSGVEIRFPVRDNPRLQGATAAQLNHIEISPLGLHWPDLDEDLSLSGLAEGDFGQQVRRG